VLDSKPSLVGLDRQELRDVCLGLSAPAYRADQVARHLYQRATPMIEEMSDLPMALRQTLNDGFCMSRLTEQVRKVSRDGVQKLLVAGDDRQVFECVLLPYKDRVSCCISSQVGCPMACTFCATGLGGFTRNLEAGEIVEQYLMLQRLSERRISHVVFMGMGEPLLNLPNVLKALHLLHDEVGLSYRHLTVSTVGIVPQILALAEQKLPIHLALSLHSPIDSVRDRLMPVNHKWPVQEVMSAMKRYQAITGRKITIEYLLIHELTDSLEQADKLATLVRDVPSVVNLIPFNWVDTKQGFSRPTRDNVNAFRRRLELKGVNVTERTERGHDIAAACGQLAGAHQGQPKGARTDLKEIPVSAGSLAG
jgi:23S rRNA (adenine2503-C2)-methyltransferase